MALTRTLCGLRLTFQRRVEYDRRARARYVQDVAIAVGVRGRMVHVPGCGVSEDSRSAGHLDSGAEECWGDDVVLRLCPACQGADSVQKTELVCIAVSGKIMTAFELWLSRKW